MYIWEIKGKLPYNRADKLEQCIQSLEACVGASETTLYIICDGPKENSASKVEEVRRYVESYTPSSVFQKVIVEKKDKNVGLAGSVIDGVSRVLDKHGKVIVVEDDLIVKPRFLLYMNGALDYYEKRPEYGSISAFTYPLKELKDYREDVYATPKAECWGWATWEDRWNSAKWADTDFESYLRNRRLRKRFEQLEAGLDRLMYMQYKGKIDSWAVRWVYHLFSQGLLTVYPTVSRVVNDGFDGSGTHCDDDRSMIGGARNAGSMGVDEPDISKIKWEKCEVNSYLEKKYAMFPRRKLVFYIPQTLYYMLRKS